MNITQFRGCGPSYNESNFLANGCQLIGKVTLEENVNIWFNSVLRGDVNEIYIGANTNIQDLSVLHVTEEYSVKIGKNVTIGHSAILHGCTIGEGSLIGMGAKVLDGAIIGKNCLVAAGSVIPPGKNYEDGTLIVGSPGRAIKKLSPEEIHQISNHYASYVGYAKEYLNLEN